MLLWQDFGLRNEIRFAGERVFAVLVLFPEECLPLSLKYAVVLAT